MGNRWSPFRDCPIHFDPIFKAGDKVPMLWKEDTSAK